MTTRRPFLGLLQRRSRLVPTWRGWLLVLAVFGTALVVGARSVHGFLAVEAPLPGGILVVEGWSSDYRFEGAVAEFRRNHYDMVCITGGPIEVGSPFRKEKTYAEFGKVLLAEMGLPGEVLHAVIAPKSKRDRTFASGMALRHWLVQRGMSNVRVNIVGNGAHSRRTLLLFEKALAGVATAGITSIEEDSYDPAQWWRTSQGFRVVTGELIAYLYARFLFFPPPLTP